MAKELNIEDLISEFAATQFESRPFHSAQDDSIQWHFEDVDQYAERIDNWLTIYRAFDDKRMVGFKLKNINALLSAFDRLGLKVAVSEKKWSVDIDLEKIVGYLPWALPNWTAQPTYRELLPRMRGNAVQLNQRTCIPVG